MLGFLSIISSFESNKTKTEEDVELIKSGDEKLRNKFISRHKNFILSVASKSKGRFIQPENDEEYSVAITAFNRAIDKFEEGKNASFFSFAGLLIKRDLIDLYRKNINNDELLFSQLTEEESDSFENTVAIRSMNEENRHLELKMEIGIYKTLLSEFSIKFEELAKISPKHIDSRINILKIARTVYENNDLKNELFMKKRLPLSKILSMVEASRKTLEKHRKYIIANVILLNSDLEYIKEYINDVL
ncbi:MAG: RNA polymerase sigma-I factor [Clostridiales bacterium]|nr:RNA polymerase sigma-I factor [Clostridiales bacterium]